MNKLFDGVSPLSDCKFETERLQVDSWKNYISTPGGNKRIFAERIISLLTPEVAKSLPEGWQKIDTIEKASKWIKARNEESAVFAIQYAPENLLAGFLLLNEVSTSDPNKVDVRLGYFLSEETWGKGLGSELIKGLIEWCANAGNISSISGGVEINNKASMRVLEKNGFRILPSGESAEGMIFMEKKFIGNKL